MQPRAPSSFLYAPGNGIFVHWTWAALKSTEQKLILKVICKGINGRLTLCYSCMVLKEHLKWLGFSAEHFLFLILLGFCGVWVFVLAVVQAYVPPEKHYGWLGNPYMNNMRRHMRVKWAEMRKAGWLEGWYSPRGSLAFVSYLILFLPALCSVPHDLLTESCSAAVFTSWHKFIFVCWPITPTALTVVYFLLLHPLELLLTVSLLSRDGLFGTGACRPAKLMDHICYLTSCKGSSFRTACSCCGHL